MTPGNTIIIATNWTPAVARVHISSSSGGSKNRLFGCFGFLFFPQLEFPISRGLSPHWLGFLFWVDLLVFTYFRSCPRLPMSLGTFEGNFDWALIIGFLIEESFLWGEMNEDNMKTTWFKGRKGIYILVYFPRLLVNFLFYFNYLSNHFHLPFCISNDKIT